MMVAEEEIIRQFNALLKNFAKFKNFKDIKIKSIEDIKKIPVTTRQDVKSWNISSCPKKPIEIRMTSGFTGKSIFIFCSGESQKALLKRWTEMYKEVGAKKGDIFISFLSFQMSPLALESARKYGMTVIPFGLVHEKSKRRLIPFLVKKLLPKIIIAYPNQLCHIFENLGKSSIEKCISAAEPLPTSLRDYIQKEKGVQIYDIYGANEIVPISIQETPQSDYMKIFPGVYVLVMNKEGELLEEGEGEIIITDLNNFSMPFVNYKLGDKIILKQKGNDKYLKILGREEPFFKFNAELFSKPDVLDRTFNALKNFDFLILITKDSFFRDQIVIQCERKNKEKISLLKKSLEEINLFPKITLKEKIPLYGSERKPLRFIDLRQKQKKKL